MTELWKGLAKKDTAPPAQLAGDLFINASFREPASTIRQGAYIAIQCQAGELVPADLYRALKDDSGELKRVGDAAVNAHAKGGKGPKVVEPLSVKGFAGLAFGYADEFLVVSPDDLDTFLQTDLPGLTHPEADRQAYNLIYQAKQKKGLLDF